MRFSVIVPRTTKRPTLAARGLVLHQDYTGRYGVIVVDNNSTDGTAAIASRYGVPSSRNLSRGWRGATARSRLRRGEIIISTDATPPTGRLAADHRCSLR